MYLCCKVKKVASKIETTVCRNGVFLLVSCTQTINKKCTKKQTKIPLSHFGNCLLWTWLRVLDLEIEIAKGRVSNDSANLSSGQEIRSFYWKWTFYDNAIPQQLTLVVSGWDKFFFGSVQSSESVLPHFFFWSPAQTIEWESSAKMNVTTSKIPINITPQRASQSFEWFSAESPNAWTVGWCLSR